MLRDGASPTDSYQRAQTAEACAALMVKLAGTRSPDKITLFAEEAVFPWLGCFAGRLRTLL